MAALKQSTDWFLMVMHEQIRFMNRSLNVPELHTRYFALLNDLMRRAMRERKQSLIVLSVWVMSRLRICLTFKM